ncbi:MAG: PQQ-binding-like beta-propeller repeat protein [Bacteroidales bacterium]|nr:PQQ-binding-like beta-propeller repeat protein [Bacteroidales bacterium]
MRYFRFIILSCLLVTLATFTACMALSELDMLEAESNWTIFRGNASLSGFTDRSLPENPTLKWCFKNDVRTVASPIIYDGVAFTCDRKGIIRGIDEMGQQCFEYDLQSPVEASFIVHDSVLYVGRIDGILSAISLRTDKALWHYETEGQISASPNIIVKNGEARVLVGSYDDNMYTFNAANGKKLGQFETDYYINGATALWNDYMVFGGCDSWLRVINTQTGEATDSMELKAYVPASPAIMGDYAFVSDYAGNIYEIHLENGKIKDHRMLLTVDKKDDDGGSVSIPAVTHDAVFIYTAERYVVCINRSDGTERWRKMLKGITGEASPLVCRDKLLVCTKDGHVSILNTKTGEELWHYEVGEQIIASPAVLEGSFYILTSRGKLFYFAEK